jgi:hypothetical protein
LGKESKSHHDGAEHEEGSQVIVVEEKELDKEKDERDNIKEREDVVAVGETQASSGPLEGEKTG